MRKFLFVFAFVATSVITLPLAILWCGFDVWRVFIENEAEIAIGEMKE